MKFTQIVKTQTVNYRLCDELTCKRIALNVIEDDDVSKEKHLCDHHSRQYHAELNEANAKQSNS